MEEAAIKELKDKGNDCFACGDHEAAAAHYSRGLDACGPRFPELRAAMLCNRAACHLKVTRWDECVHDCDAAPFSGVGIRDRPVPALSAEADVSRAGIEPRPAAYTGEASRGGTDWNDRRASGSRGLRGATGLVKSTPAQALAIDGSRAKALYRRARAKLCGNRPLGPAQFSWKFDQMVSAMRS